MSCPKAELCGGCVFQNKDDKVYRQEKFSKVKTLLSSLAPALPWGEPVFITDGTRRRASMAFSYNNKKITLGFNQRGSNIIVDIDNCLLLTHRLNSILPDIRNLLQAICAIPFQVKNGKKIIYKTISVGDVWLCDCTNGIDITLEYDAPLDLEHRMVICEFINHISNVVRISHRRKNQDIPEPIVEISKPFIKISPYTVYIPAGTFLQPSQEGESALINMVKEYVGECRGKIFDLFCGVGTFSYALAASNPQAQIVAVDSSSELLQGFSESLKRNQITNIEILERNLFKYPLDKKELSGADVVVFDPPRAGASAQTKVLASLDNDKKPKTIVAISCYPPTFVNDAKALISSGYKLEKINFVDQFIYSNHSELVAVFTKL